MAVGLSKDVIDKTELEADKKGCRRFGPCGVGEKAVYLGSRFIDRHYYVPLASVQRVYKLVAMSKGGFTGKGAFGSIPYVVVEYDHGSKKTVPFKYEDQVDQMLEYLNKVCPRIRTVSEAAEKRLAKAEAERRARFKKDLSEEAKRSLAELEECRSYLDEDRETCRLLAGASKAMRIMNATNPFYKYVALAIVAGGFIAAVFGVWSMLSRRGGFGVYFTLIGLSAIMFFSSANVMPTAKSNRKAVEAGLAEAREKMSARLDEYQKRYGREFPLPVRYAHPVAITRMMRSIQEGRAETIPESYELLKTDLKALNSSVTVSQEEYDEVVTIKPMFLLEDYR